MKVRLLAGIGMLLLAVGTLTIFFLTDGQMPDFLSTDQAPSLEFGIPSAVAPTQAGPSEVDSFLEEYNANYRRLWTDLETSSWNAASNSTAENIETKNSADKKMAEYVGSRLVIEKLRMVRGRLDLTDIQDRQIEMAWQLAAHYPGSIAGDVEKLKQTESALMDSLNSYQYTLILDGQEPQEITTYTMDEMLQSSRDPKARLTMWEAGQSMGPKLKEGLVDIQTLRNTTAQEMGYSSFFELEAADYGMNSLEMVQLMDEIVAGIMPLYEQLHCWVKHELAARYGVTEIPERIPAQWLNDRQGRTWSGVVEGVDQDAMFRDVQPQWMIEQAERFYTSMGFDPLPLTFWGRSDLFELPEGSERQKENEASSWHIDLDQDVRSLMSVKADFNWFQTTHHELGQIYYALAYSRDDVPPILRTGANPAFNQSIGSLVKMASGHVSYMQQVGLMSDNEVPEEIRSLLTQALQGPIVSLPFTCGTITHWESDFYEENLPRHQMNTRWWEYSGRYQGVEAPAPRGEEYCDPATQPSIIQTPARGYDEALSSVIQYQLHRYICREILDQDVRTANYFGNKQVGMYLHSILQLGATRDWRLVMQQATGEDLSSEALFEYYSPLMAWLQEQNAGREVGF